MKQMIAAIKKRRKTSVFYFVGLRNQAGWTIIYSLDPLTGLVYRGGRSGSVATFFHVVFISEEF